MDVRAPPAVAISSATNTNKSLVNPIALVSKNSSGAVKAAAVDRVNHLQARRMQAHVALAITI